MQTSSMQSAPKLNPTYTNDGIVVNKSFLITILIVLLILSVLGINLLTVFGNFFQIIGNLFQVIINIFKPIIIQILSLFGYTTGTVLNATADVVSDTAKTGIDIASGTIQSVGNILKDSSENAINPDAKKQFDDALNVSNLKKGIPNMDVSNSNIQKSNKKTQWCLAGEFKGRRGCVEIDEETKCMSGQIFPSQHQCLNPNLTNNMQ
jgi:hypothetical protein